MRRPTRPQQKQETQQFMGKNQLIKRLTAQVGDKDKAMGILKGYGYVDDEGKLTKKGQARDNMTAEERALDRASKTSKKPENRYKYNPTTNRATLKRR